MKRLFALRFKGTDELVGVGTISNHEAGLCTSVSYVLDRNSDFPWVVTDRNLAVLAAETDTEWYNAVHGHPENPYVGQLEVVELKVSSD